MNGVSVSFRWFLRGVGCTLLILSVYSAQASAQGVLQQANMGTLEILSQDDGRLVISGRAYSYDDEVTEVYLRGERIRASVLNPGMVVRFMVNARGILERIEILGPFSEIRLLEQH